MFVLAHLSDGHLAPLPVPNPFELASKRGLGFLNWLRKRHRIHRREVLDALVALPFIHVRSLEQLETDPEKGATAIDSAMEREEQKQQLAKGIATLPEKERLVITLYYMEDLRLKEIGAVLNLSESRVSRLLASAQHHLREYVNAHDNDDT